MVSGELLKRGIRSFWKNKLKQERFPAGFEKTNSHAVNYLLGGLVSGSWRSHSHNHKELDSINNVNKLGRGPPNPDVNGAQATPRLHPCEMPQRSRAWTTDSHQLWKINGCCFKPIGLQWFVTQHRKRIRLVLANWLTLRVHNFQWREASWDGRGHPCILLSAYQMRPSLWNVPLFSEFLWPAFPSLTSQSRGSKHDIMFTHFTSQKP